MSTAHRVVHLPPVEDIPADGYLVEYLDAGPDSLGRRSFCAYWRDEHKPQGIAAQCFNTNPDLFAPEHEVREWSR